MINVTCADKGAHFLYEIQKPKTGPQTLKDNPPHWTMRFADIEYRCGARGWKTT